MRKTSRVVLGSLAVCLFSMLALAHPGSGIVVDRLGQVYFLDTGSGLWRIDARGAVTHLSPLRNHWLAIDAGDRFPQNRIPTDAGRDWVITAVASNPTLLISTDFPLTIGPDGNLYYPSVRETNARLLRKTPTGGTSAFVTLPRSVAGSPIPWINGIAAAPDGSIYYTEDNTIRRVTPDAKVSTVATVPALARGPAIPGNETHPYLRGLKVDASGTVYVADAGDARVLKIAPDGKTTTLLQLESPWAPTDVALFGDVVYVLEFLHTVEEDRLAWMPRIRKITPDGRSAIILTVDQMPGARPAKIVASTSFDVFWAEFRDLLLRSFLHLT
ncbi:MAG TPA: SMP-30/gluconolactonase/LRE family protein [Pyrinomonadaceae bacterium]|nr:SMP-30/gluconolactonase/LRE family protein [Pyrinomonadaceae bacterium]